MTVQKCPQGINPVLGYQKKKQQSVYSFAGISHFLLSKCISAANNHKIIRLQTWLNSGLLRTPLSWLRIQFTPVSAGWPTVYLLSSLFPWCLHFLPHRHFNAVLLFRSADALFYDEPRAVFLWIPRWCQKRPGWKGNSRELTTSSPSFCHFRQTQTNISVSIIVLLMKTRQTLRRKW